MNAPAAEVVRNDLIPDFCHWRPLLLVALIMELIAVVLTLAGGIGTDVIGRFTLTSLYLQWCGICSAAVLCWSRGPLRRSDPRTTFLVAWVLLAGVNFVISASGYEVLLRWGPPAAGAPFESRASFMFRHVAIGAAVSLLVLRYFWLQNQWRKQVLAEGELRYQALQARIRPHFLFNSLNSIAALVGVRPEVAETLIEDMAELLRAGLDARSRLVPLEDELALVHAYLRIEQARLGERLKVEWRVADSALPLEVPLLSVQPLVENAVYHGIERIATPGLIEVTVNVAGSRMEIEVGNPLADPGATPHQGQRIALDNIAQRLALIYGDGKARLELGEHGNRYVARLSLPVVQGVPDDAGRETA